MSKQLVERITLRQLRVFVAYIRCGTVKGAASQLCISSPAVSQQLRLLEDIVGTPLAVKTDEGIRTTETGSELLLAASRIEQSLSHCQQTIGSKQHPSAQRVSVGIFESASYFAPKVIAHFKQAHPELDVRIDIKNKEAIFQAIRENAFDFALIGKPPANARLETLAIGSHPLVLVGAASNPLAERTALTLRDLVNETFLLRESGSGTRLIMLRLLEEAHLFPRSILEINSNESIKQFAMAGLGVALVSAHTAATDIDSGSLCVLNLDCTPIVRTWQLARNRDNPLSPAAQALWTLFKQYGEEHLR